MCACGPHMRLAEWKKKKIPTRESHKCTRSSLLSSRCMYTAIPRCARDKESARLENEPRYISLAWSYKCTITIEFFQCFQPSLNVFQSFSKCVQEAHISFYSVCSLSLSENLCIFRDFGHKLKYWYFYTSSTQPDIATHLHTLTSISVYFFSFSESCMHNDLDIYARCHIPAIFCVN